MQIESVSISSLVFDPANARKHNQKNLDAIKGSLTKFGQQKPIVVDAKGVVIAGNGTLDAARSLGWTEINVVRTDLTGTDAVAFALADNRTAELAEWDTEILSETLKGLQEQDFDITSIGFDTDFITEAPNEGLTDEDAVPENVETRCKPGDLWILGNHRVLCGDSTNVQHVERLMSGKKADMVFTSPPYNGNTKLAKNWNDRKPLYQNDSDNKTPSEYLNFNRSIFSGFMVACSEKANIFYNVNYNKNSRSLFINVVANAIGDGFNLFETIVWKKTGMPNPSRQVMTRDWEFIFLFNRSDEYQTNKEWHGYSSNYWEISNQNAQEKDHKACFPVALPAKAISEMSKAGALLFEPFCGSGSTLIACEKTNRTCYGMEIDPHYCDVIIKRWEDFTGKKALLKTEA